MQKWTLICCVVLILQACTTMKPLPTTGDIRQHIHIGDNLIVTQNNGDQIEIDHVRAITQQHITGQDTKVSISDIQAVQKKEYDILKSIEAGAWGILLFLMLALP